jgi:hypothetical protein
MYFNIRTIKDGIQVGNNARCQIREKKLNTVFLRASNSKLTLQWTTSDIIMSAKNEKHKKEFFICFLKWFNIATMNYYVQ